MGKISKKFKYDVIKLLDSIKERPCLWDTQSDQYKNRIHRRNAWDEIFNILDSAYDSMSAEEQRITASVIQTKWTNIRDTFIRSLRRGDKQKRKYVLYDFIKFIAPSVPKYDNFEFGTEDSSEPPLREEIDPEPEVPRRKRKKRVYSQSSEDKDAVEPESSPGIDYVDVNDPRIMNEDEAFFASLLPTVVKYSEDERLTFRLEVLNVMKGIKDDRKWTNN